MHLNKQESVLKILPAGIRDLFGKAGIDPEELQEIRMRVNRPLICICNGSETFLSSKGKLRKGAEDCYYVSRPELQETLSYISRYSLYAFEEELRQGYITIPGGHRVGIAGKVVSEGGRIQCIKQISFLNVRLSHERKGCADPVLPYLIQRGRFCHTLIISPPKCGKTTLLRDLIRQVSGGMDQLPGQKVGVVDERSEIAGSFQGIPQNDLGIRTDVLDGCPKAHGMMMLIRSMSPDIIAVDEIGDERDSQAIEAVFHCGCKLLATVHGNSIEDIRKKPLLQRLLQYRCFERYVVLDHDGGAGHVKDIFDERGSRLNG